MRTGIDRFFLNFTEKVKVPRGVFTGAKRNTEGRSDGLFLIVLVFIPHMRDIPTVKGGFFARGTRRRRRPIQKAES